MNSLIYLNYNLAVPVMQNSLLFQNNQGNYNPTFQNKLFLQLQRKAKKKKWKEFAEIFLQIKEKSCTWKYSSIKGNLKVEVKVRLYLC